MPQYELSLSQSDRTILSVFQSVQNSRQECFGVSKVEEDLKFVDRDFKRGTFWYPEGQTTVKASLGVLERLLIQRLPKGLSEL